MIRMPCIHRCQHRHQHVHRGFFGKPIIKTIMSIIRCDRHRSNIIPRKFHRYNKFRKHHSTQRSYEHNKPQQQAATTATTTTLSSSSHYLHRRRHWHCSIFDTNKIPLKTQLKKKKYKFGVYEPLLCGKKVQFHSKCGRSTKRQKDIHRHQIACNYHILLNIIYYIAVMYQIEYRQLSYHI